MGYLYCGLVLGISSETVYNFCQVLQFGLSKPTFFQEVYSFHGVKICI